MKTKTLFITPPFTQLNTPYPATAYLKGFFNSLGLSSSQLDLGIEVTLELFSKNGLTQLFESIDDVQEYSNNAQRIYSLQHEYCKIIDQVILFLQQKNSTLAHLICTRNLLPEAARFSIAKDLDWAFGNMGIQDKARHLATLFLEDLSDFIKEVIDPHFGFSRYAERLGLSASSFDPLYDELQLENTFIDDISTQVLEGHIQYEKPDLVAISIPFPGNLYGALKCGQFIKNHFPDIKIVLGGGYVNTELRSLQDLRVFEFTDFITLDDGEAPLLNLIEFLEGKRVKDQLKRTFILENEKIIYCNNSEVVDIKQKDIGIPDYSGLPIDEYLSVIEIANPMHRLWNDGRWNKLTLAHGCYWGKCTFCDISLDYIKIYEQSSAQMICDKMEELISQTGEIGFHFVDEAAPPALMKELALEIIKRELTVVWWTNIRFEKSFTYDLCQLLKTSGCIAVSGGLEVASDRLLKLIDKGASVAQVANVTNNFTQAGIMVHAYLMYGFPTQTSQETIDSLEMVRQLFELGIVQSGFWHQFAMTAHSPVGLHPEQFNVEAIGPTPGGFAHNDLWHKDPTGAHHEDFSDGLKKSLFNYMHGVGFDFELQEWFEKPVPLTIIADDYIESCLDQRKSIKPNAKVIWLGHHPITKMIQKKKKGKLTERSLLSFENKTDSFSIVVSHEIAEWLISILQKNATVTYKEWINSFAGPEQAINDFLNSAQFQTLRANGLLFL